MTALIPDSTRSIFHSATRFFSGTMLSRISGMVRDITLAYAFGTGSSVAALLVAFRLAHLLRRLLGEGAMQTALIPHFEELRKDSPKKAALFFCDLTLSLTYLLILIIVLTMGFLGALLFFDVLDAGNKEIVWLTFLMMPSLLFICLFGINASLLQCQKHYFSSSAAPILFNLFWIVGICVSYHFESEQAMSVLSIFVIIACFAQWLITIPQSITILKNFGIEEIRKQASFYSSDVKKLCKPLILGLIGVSASQVNNAMDAIFARWADIEGPAYLWYAIRFQQLPLGLFGVALAGALLPQLARAVKAKDLIQSRLFLKFAATKTIAFMIPVTCLLFLVGEGCLNLVYGHGGFTETSLFNTSLCLNAYTLGLLPMALILVLAPAFYAKGDYLTPSKAAIGSMGINIFINILLVAYFHLGAASIAFATSISAWVNFIWLANKLIKNNESYLVIDKELKVSTLKILLASLLATGFVIFTDSIFLRDLSYLNILFGKTGEFKLNFMTQFKCLSMSSLSFALSLGVFAFLIKAKDLTDLYLIPSRRYFLKKNSNREKTF